MHWYVDVLKKYAVFSGRARRQEYWMFFLFNMVIGIVLNIIDRAGDLGSVISFVYSLAVLIPGLAVAVRRLHDVGRSGWWLLIVVVPLVGAIILIVFLATDGEPGVNKWGENPKREQVHDF
ncbi:DUF805 domain-containing protein [Streptomyces sp. NPDC004838]